jgi:hypothetical protein
MPARRGDRGAMITTDDLERRTTEELTQLVRQQITFAVQDGQMTALKRLEVSLRCLSLWRQNITLAARQDRPLGNILTLDLDQLSTSALIKIGRLYPEVPEVEELADLGDRLFPRVKSEGPDRHG